MKDSKKAETAVSEDDWAAAMASQANAESGGDDEIDPWAEAMAEQAASSNSASEQVFKPLESGPEAANARSLEMIMDIPVKLNVELGRTRITIKQLLELAQGSVVELDGLAGDPMEILINGYLVAQGEVVVVDDKYGIRITEIISPSERIQKLNR